MAKKAKREQPAAMTRKQMAKSQKVRRRERATFIGISIVAVLVVGVLIFGAINEYVLKPEAPIATVDGAKISTKWYQKVWKYTQANTSTTMQQYQDQLDTLNAKTEKTDTDQLFIQYYTQMVSQLRSQLMNIDLAVLDSVIDDELVRQEAKKEGLVVTSEELQASIEQAFGLDRNPPEPTPTVAATATITATEPVTVTPAPTLTPGPTATRMSEEQFQTTYQKQLDYMNKQFGFSAGEFRSLFENDLLRNKLKPILEEKVPTTAEQVHARHILVETEDEAKKVLERLNAGESFEALAKELSKDEGNKEQGGDLGWFGKGAMVAEFEAVAFSLEPGKLSDPVQTEFGWHVVQVIEKDANHPLDEDALAQKKASALDDWLTSQKNTDRVKRYWSSDKIPRTSASGTLGQ